MTEDDAGTVSDVLSPLLRALEMLTFVERRFRPTHLAELLDSIGKPDDMLREPSPLGLLYPQLQTSSERALNVSKVPILLRKSVARSARGFVSVGVAPFGRSLRQERRL